MYQLTAENVDSILKHVMLDKELKEGLSLHEIKILVSKGIGISQDLGFHKGRLEEHRQDIIEMLNQLPDIYFEPQGYPPIKLNTLKDGTVWTDLLRPCNGLVALGNAIGYVKYEEEDNALDMLATLMFQATKAPPRIVYILKEQQHEQEAEVNI